MKRCFSLLLIVALLLSLCPNIGIADTVRQSGNFFYKIKGNGTAAITGYVWPSKTWPITIEDIYIPRMLDGYTVTEISAEAFANIQYNSDEQLVPLTEIATHSYYHTAGSLVIPDTVTTIGEKAFWGIIFTTKSITIPSSVQYIGAGAFSNVKGVEQFVVDTQNPVYATIEGVLFNKKTKALIAYPGSRRGEEKGVFAYHYSIPNGILEIADYAFYGVDPYVDPYAFCIQMPDTLKSIGAYSFSYANITTDTETDCLVLPSSISSIGTGAFAYARSSRWERRNFYMYNTIDLSNTTIDEIPNNAFRGCYLSGTVILPESVEVIGEYAFAELFDKPQNENDHRILRSITIPASVREIKEGAFSAKETSKYGGLQPFTFAENSQLISIGDEAFQNAMMDGAIMLPDGLKNIGDRVFSNCKGLERIVIPASVSSIGEDICSRGDVYIETEMGSYAALWASENGYMVQQSTQEDTSWLFE